MMYLGVQGELQGEPEGVCGRCGLVCSPTFNAFCFIELLSHHVKNMFLVENYGSLTAPSISIGCALLQPLSGKLFQQL